MIRRTLRSRIARRSKCRDEIDRRSPGAIAARPPMSAYLPPIRMSWRQGRHGRGIGWEVCMHELQVAGGQILNPNFIITSHEYVVPTERQASPMASTRGTNGNRRAQRRYRKDG